MMTTSRLIPTPRVFIAVGLSIFVFVSFLLYASVDTNAKLRQDVYSNAQSGNIAALKQKIDILEKQLNKNNEIISNLGRKLDDEAANLNKQPVPEQQHPIENEPDAIDLDQKQIPEPAEKEGLNQAVGRKPVTQSPQGQCAAKTAKTDVQMLDAYSQKIPFDNPDGGVWKQGFEIQYDKEAIKKEKRLEVIVIPHSHCDPGWLKTFDEYFEQQTKLILDGMLEHLGSKPDMKFIYAEMSFFETWWSKLTEEQKEKTRSYLKNGQLEIVTGGWVMTDEANARHFSIVMELIEGHEFLWNQLNFRPQNHWSIDPFGSSSTLAKLIGASNFTHMTIQRVHYSVKKFLAQTKQLEFRWRQLYAGESAKTDIRTHMFPFYSYDAPHSCGPDPSICCQFDFRRLTSIGCPWGKRPQRITDRNVAARAEVLADQYRKKAQLYRMNTVLVPLGDDFRYDSSTEWTDQYENYKQLFDYMNAKSELNINARFGTLKDYFDVLDARLKEETDEEKKDLPILSGDFFTYADRDDHYWSGYFTSRPFYKHMDRTVQHYVRSADLLYSLALWKAAQSGVGTSPLPANLYNLLVESRRSLGLFQHHDGITGTARDHVVVDYGKKMLAAIDNSTTVIEHATAYLLDTQADQLKPDLHYYLDKLPDQLKVEIGSSLLIHNSLAHDRREVVCVLVGSKQARIQSTTQPKQQIQPALDMEKGQFVVDEGKWELCFEAQVPALGFAKFEVKEGGAEDDKVAKIQVSQNFNVKLFNDPSVTVISSSDTPTLSNSRLKATFDSKSGYIKSLSKGSEKEINLEMEFLHYGARQRKSTPTFSDSMSGAYLFLPNGEAQEILIDTNAFVLMKGEVRESLYLRGPNNSLVFQHVYLDINSHSLDVLTKTDVRATSNFELSMRFKSQDLVDENDQFYTDLNGFQMIRRKRFEKLPLQAHFYPMTTAAFLDANQKRLTLLGRQALGIASLKSGQFEVILDRRLMQDDDRGLAQGVTDNLRTESHFRLHLESLPSQALQDQNRAGFLSAIATQSSHHLNYPFLTLNAKFNDATKVASSWTPLKKSFACDTHLFALRTSGQPTEYDGKGRRETKSKMEASLIVERAGVECMIQGDEKPEGCGEMSGQFNPLEHFQFGAKSLKSTSLTGMYELNQQQEQTLQLDPMDLKAIKVEF